MKSKFRGSDEIFSFSFSFKEILKEKDQLHRDLENELLQTRRELQLTVERLRKLEEDQHAQLTESESTTNYLERRIHDLDKVTRRNKSDFSTEISSISVKISVLVESFERNVWV